MYLNNQAPVDWLGCVMWKMGRLSGHKAEAQMCASAAAGKLELLFASKCGETFEKAVLHAIGHFHENIFCRPNGIKELSE